MKTLREKIHKLPKAESHNQLTKILLTRIMYFFYEAGLFLITPGTAGKKKRCYARYLFATRDINLID